MKPAHSVLSYLTCKAELFTPLLVRRGLGCGSIENNPSTADAVPLPFQGRLGLREYCEEGLGCGFVKQT